MKYELHGLIVESDLTIAAAPSDSDPDVIIESHIAAFDPGVPDGHLLAGDPDGQWASLVDTDTGLIVHVPGVCRFTIDRSLARVGCTIAPAADPGMAAILASGNLIATLLGLRGIGVLHASAVCFPDRQEAGIAIAGPSGMGKSTLAAMLCDAGAALISDDVLRLDETLRCYRGGAHIRLRESAAALAGPASGPATPDGRILVRPPVAADRIPLRAVVLPRPSRDRSAVEVRTLPAAEAAAELIRCSRIMGWRHRDAMRAQFELATRIAAAVPVIEAHIPWGPPFEPRIVAQLRAALP